MFADDGYGTSQLFPLENVVLKSGNILRFKTKSCHRSKINVEWKRAMCSVSLQTQKSSNVGV